MLIVKRYLDGSRDTSLIFKYFTISTFAALLPFEMDSILERRDPPFPSSHHFKFSLGY